MFIIKALILTEHMKLIGSLMMLDRSIGMRETNILYHVQPVTKLFYDQEILLMIFILMAMNQCD